MRCLINASAFQSVFFYIVRRSSMGCVLLYLSMFCGFNPNKCVGNKRRKNIYLHFLIKFLLINKYG